MKEILSELTDRLFYLVTTYDPKHCLDEFEDYDELWDYLQENLVSEPLQVFDFLYRVIDSSDELKSEAQELFSDYSTAIDWS